MMKKFIGLLALLLMLAGCTASLSEQQAIDAFLTARGESVHADSVVVNGITLCELDEEDRVALNVTEAWVVSYTYVSAITDTEQHIALLIGRTHDGAHEVVGQGGCP